MNTSYDQCLKNIAFYSVHEEYLPFIGDDYDKYKILQIGESHYLSQRPDNATIHLTDFEKWETTACIKVYESSPDYYHTRKVIQNYMDGYKGSYDIFNNFSKSFSKIVLKSEVNHISTQDKKRLYNNLAFMNFFQMPSLFFGMKFWNSLQEDAKILGNKKLAQSVWDECVSYSVSTLDDVIDIIKPSLIVFTSISAGRAYNGKYAENPKVVITSHSGDNRVWHRSLKSLNNQSGIAVIEKAFEEYINNK